MLRSYCIVKNAEIFSGKYNLNLKDKGPNFLFLNTNIPAECNH